MNLKKVLIFVLLISSTWAVNSNDNPEDDDNISSSSVYSYLRSDDSNDGKKEITRKYKCPTCDKSYTQSHNLKTHRQKVHGL